MISHAECADLAARVYRPAWSRTVALDVHYALDPRPGETVVVLPGTHPADALDWLRDADVWPLYVPGLRLLHRGFGAGACAAWAAMARDLAPDRLVTFTGHSLGGALALCLAALHARARPATPFRVVTFGAPRPAFCNPVFRALLARGVERALYARRGDVVPHLPFRPLYGHGAALTPIGQSLGAPLADHSVARYGADVAALGL